MINTWDRFDAYLFDIDGTLLECTDAVHYFAFCDVLTTIAGRPMNLEGVTTHGNTDVGILHDALRQAGLPDERWTDRLPEMRRHMVAYVSARIEQVCARPHQAIHKTLLHLRRREAYLGVATGNLEAIGTVKLHSAGLFDYFHFGAWSDLHRFRKDFGRARDVAMTATTASLQRLAWQIPTTDPASKYLVVFNPHAWPIKKEVEYDLGWDANVPAQVEDENGRSLPFQWVNATTVVTNRRGLLAEVEVPAMGYRQIRVRRAEQTTQSPQGVPHATENSLENAHLRLSFSNDGGIGLYDKDAKREVFANAAGGMRAVVLDDLSDTWSHHIRAYDKEVGAFRRTEVKVLEDGPLRARIRETRSYNASTLTIDWILYAGSQMLDAKVTLDWHEHLKMLKFSYPVNTSNPKVTTEIAYGALPRTNEGDEDPGQRWIDLTGTEDGQSYGLAVINDAKYGYSVQGTDVRVSIARAAVYAHHEPRVLEPGVDYQWMDQGVQSFQMQLLPHTGSWQDTNVVRAAEELVSTTPVVYQGIHPGTRKGSDSFLSVDAQDVIVEAVKESEDGDDLIVRAYETAGRPTKAIIRMATPAATWAGDFHAFEIKTLRVDRHTGKVKETDALED